jgi:small subunit ribosomal protein S1
MIINVDRKTRSIQLSIKARDTADSADSMQRMSEAGASSGTTNLGALLKAKLSQAKDDE